MMAGLDSGISNTVLPVIATSLGVDVASAQWVVSVYVLVLSCLLLAFGRLGDLHGYKRIYLAGFALFVLASATCAFSPGIGVLIAARAVQAIGAAMLAANSPAILISAFPDEQRGRALGFQATAVYLGLAAGPPLGGWLTAVFGWGAVFLVNVPIGVADMILAARVIPRDRPALKRGESFDVTGAALFTAGVLVLIFGLNQVHVWGWTSPLLAACALVAVLALGAFVATERRAIAPMLDLHLFASRAFSASVISATLNYMATFSMIFLLPFYLIEARQLSVALAGLVLTAQPVVMAMTAPFSGALSDRLGPRLPATVGMVIIALCLGVLSRLGLDTPLINIIAVLLVLGIGVGLFTAPNTSAALGAVPGIRRGVASAVLATARNLGMVLGIGVAGAVFTSILTQVGASSQAVVEGASAGLSVAAVVAAIGALTSAAAL
jgi:EmrB/QacA subfamily drug resistance transporter